MSILTGIALGLGLFLLAMWTLRIVSAGHRAVRRMRRQVRRRRTLSIKRN